MNLHHLCIQTDQYKASLKFYTEILGFEMIKETPDFHNRYYNSWLKKNALLIELQTNKKDEMLYEFDKKNKGIVHIGVVVDDLMGEYRRIKELGFDRFLKKLDQDVYVVENGKLFKIVAPEGTIIEFRDHSEIVGQS